MPPPPTAKMKSTSAIKLRHTMRGYAERVTSVAHLPDGRRFITGSSNGSLRLWNLESSMQIVNDWHDDGKEAVWSIALSPNGKTVASGSYTTIRLWDIETKKVVARWTGHTDYVWSLCWSVDGERMVSGSHDGTIKVWDIKSGDTVLGPINTGYRFVWATMYSPDTTKIATCGSNGALKIWHAKTGNLLSTIKHDDGVCSLAWTSDQKKLIIGSRGSIRIFDTATWQQIAILEGHTEYVTSLSLFQNDRLLVSGSIDNTAWLWNLDTNLSVGPPFQHESAVGIVAISTDGKLLVTGCDDNNAYAWDVHTTLKNAGLEELLSIPDMPQDALKQKAIASKSLMDVYDLLATLGHECNYPHFRDATRRQRKHEYTCRLPPRFLDDPQDDVHSSWTPRRRDLIDTPPPIASPTSTQSKRTPEPITQSSTTTSSAITPRPFILSKWWPIHTHRVLPPVVDVPLAQGYQRNAAAGAPKDNDGLRPAEEFDPPPPSQIRNTDSQQQSTVAQTSNGEHGTGRFCCCL